MAERPLILALANPVPEIEPEEARAARPDAIIATGRSDYPNQVNNVLCFPFIFRGALDVGATTINEEMKIACAQAIAAVARTTAPDTVAAAYGVASVSFGPECIIPKPFDSRLAVELPIAVARAAMASGVATRPIEDLDAYRERLSQFVFRSGLTMKPIFERARARPMRVVFADGEEERVLRAVEVLLDERLARPILIGRPDVVRARIAAPGAALQRRGATSSCAIPRAIRATTTYVAHYLARMGRRGRDAGGGARDRAHAHHGDRRDHGRPRRGGRPDRRADRPLPEPRPPDPGRARPAPGRRMRARRVHLVILERGALFMADTYVSVDPPAEEIAETTLHGRRDRAPLRHRAQGGAALALQLRQPGDRQRGQDAPCPRA